jgi:hypothetical protein
MKAAPPVRVRAGASLGWRQVQAVLAAVAVGAIAWWAVALAHESARPGAMLLGAGVAMMGALLAARVSWRCSAVAAIELLWDGQRWRAEGAEVEPQVMLDGGGWLLLRLNGTDMRTTRWVDVGRAAAGPAWHGLRAALHARAPVARPPSTSGQASSSDNRP